MEIKFLRRVKGNQENKIRNGIIRQITILKIVEKHINWYGYLIQMLETRQV